MYNNRQKAVLFIERRDVMQKNICLHPYEVADVLKLNMLPRNIQQINAPAFWKHVGNVRPIGAIIDTGIDTTHPEFKERIFASASFDGTNNVQDTDGHGTHVAGIAAGESCGVFPKARLVPLKVKFGQGSNLLNFYDAFLYILDHNKKCKDEDKIVAVNCSFDGPADMMMNYYIRALVESDVSVVSAAGNRGDGDPTTEECFSYPGFIWESITTGALNIDGTIARYSSSYDGIDIAAPGTEIYSTWPGGGYKLLSGTSMAAPHVFGAILLIKAAFRNKYGRWPTTNETENMLFGQVRKVPIDIRLVGHGVLYLNGNPIIEDKVTDVAPFIYNNRTMVSARFVSEGLGAKVDWDEKTKTVTAQLGNKTVEMQIDRKEYITKEERV